MVINIDAFKEKVTKKEGAVGQVRMHSRRDDLNGAKPIELIQETNPIVIIDEPQSVANTDKSKEAINSLNPLCTLRYSATHIDKLNMLYKLDSIDAYEQKLVKQIEVASIDVKNNHNQAYIKLISVKSNPRQASVEVDVMSKGKVTRKKITVRTGEDLFDRTKNPVYEGFDINDIYTEEDAEYINFYAKNEIIFLGKSIGQVDELLKKRLQIRKTIEEHLNKELRLTPKGIKVLSLFFLDKVSNYRIYDKSNNRSAGIFCTYFEEEFKDILAKNPKYRNIYPSIYLDDGQLNKVALNELVAQVHNGYFAADKKKNTSGDMVEVYKESTSTKGAPAKSASDIDAYKLIMTDKEKLLDLKEPLRFIFSHSALKEGWDNPNVFQICTLNESGSTIKKRQEIGRGLRICVNQEGERVHGFDVNTLTVMANESYEDFVSGLQKEIEDEENVHFGIVEEHLFANINIAEEGKPAEYLGADKSAEVYLYIKDNGYISSKGKVEDKLKTAIKDNNLLLPEQFADVKIVIFDKLKQVVGRNLKIKPADKKKTVSLNKKIFLSDEFKQLWDRVKYKTYFKLEFDEDKLIKEIVEEIKDNLVCSFSKFEYRKALTAIERSGVNITDERIATQLYKTRNFPLPDIVSYLQEETNLTRRAIVKILQDSDRIDLFKKNPQRFIEQACEIIIKKKQLFIVDGIKYEKIGEHAFFDQKLFEDNELFGYLNKNMIEAKCSVHDYVVYDSETEELFAKELESRDEVKLYAKLPSRWFKIDTPLGSYNPDWAVLIERDGSEHLYFVVETKSSMLSSDLREAENKKIKCGKKHFKAIGENTEFLKAKDYDSFVDQII
jgi:type III restriction enzyme